MLIQVPFDRFYRGKVQKLSMVMLSVDVTGHQQTSSGLIMHLTFKLLRKLANFKFFIFFISQHFNIIEKSS